MTDFCPECALASLPTHQQHIKERVQYNTWRRECALSLSHHPFPFTNSVHSTRWGKMPAAARVHATQWQILCDARLFSAPLISAAKHRANFLILCARLKNDTLGYWLVSSPPLDEKIWLADLGLFRSSVYRCSFINCWVVFLQLDYFLYIEIWRLGERRPSRWTGLKRRWNIYFIVVFFEFMRC